MWSTFQSFLGHCHAGIIKDSVEPFTHSRINVSTMTTCFRFNQPIDLERFHKFLPESIVIYNPTSKKSKVPKKKGTDTFYNSFEIKLSVCDYNETPHVFSNVSVFLFPNGKAKAAGIKTINTINITIAILIDLISECCELQQELVANTIKIQMICSDFKIKPIRDSIDGWCVKQEEIKNIIVEKGYSATFSSLNRYPGINAKIPSIIEDGKNVSVLIFRSGSVIITGAKNAQDIAHCYKFVIDLFREVPKNLFYYDINEEIKQKKKKIMD
jgi:TATA-box binding protein (TBP) (component of TFIID and TFIIIB)